MTSRSGSVVSARRRPHVALVIHEAAGAQGTDRVVIELVRRAHEKVEFTVVSRTLAADVRPLVRWCRAPAPQALHRRKIFTFLVTGGWRTLRARPDLVHVHAVGPTVPNRADILTVHFSRQGYYEAAGVLPGGGLSPTLHAALERWCFRRASVLAVLSGGSRRELTAHFPKARIVLTPNGVDADLFRPDAATREAVRASLGVGDDERVALFVGNGWGRQGLDLIIEALGQRERSPLLWVIGYGDEPRYRKECSDRGIGERVRFFGVQPDVLRFYQAADLFLLPSLYEQASLAAWEAAAAGLPVVATRVHGIAELVGDDEAGVLIERDPGSIAGALDRLCTDHQLRTLLGRRARKRAVAYTWDRSVRAVLDVYGELLARREGLLRPAI
jgi:glycosyltransferase involved in cell wall biosynthesis